MRGRVGNVGDMEPPPKAALAAGLAAAVLLHAGAALASIALPTDVETLSRRADLIVRGTTVDSRAVRSADGRQIQTITTVRVAFSLKGLPPLDVEIVTPGGTLDGVTQAVSGAPLFARGEQVMLFLMRAGRRFRVAGLSQGKFEIVEGPGGGLNVTQRTQGLEVVDRDGAVRPAPGLAPVPITQFLARVNAALPRQERN